jgi:AcrR family transcriptional regulator
VATRRRGSALQRAIFDAALEQLRTVGYANLTMEGVAAAARTGKAALYRRWASKNELMLDALRDTLPSPVDVMISGCLRDDILALLRCYRSMLDTTRGLEFRQLRGDKAREPGVHAMIRERVAEPCRHLILEVLQRGAEEGRVRPEAATAQVAKVGPAMLLHHCLTDGPEVPDEVLVAVVDEVVMPLVRPATRGTYDREG